jgi:cytoplasmic iron level regulating protein YaaA (DUF328/UPF0246 family)
MPPAPRPLLLLPPSKGKASGGRGRRSARTRSRHPLASARREVLAAAVASAEEQDTALLVRRCGVVAADAETARRLLRALPEAPTMPASQRYAGVLHRAAGLADLDAGAAALDVRIVSPLLGLVALDEPVPEYRLELTATLPALGGLGTFWRARLADHLAEIAQDVRVWDLLPAEHARVWPTGLRDRLDVVDVRFLRPDGRSANAARTKVAKGRLAAALLAGEGVDPEGLARRRDLTSVARRLFGEGWTLAVDGRRLIATCHL